VLVNVFAKKRAFSTLALAVASPFSLRDPVPCGIPPPTFAGHDVSRDCYEMLGGARLRRMVGVWMECDVAERNFVNSWYRVML